ncbi:hypothetical protein TCAL_05430 [Tigriopus californicus]|uniref:G-protein coupled receptors family 1 profile domain-containing protein n=1 Tax=Tigriopus californicus TaxID=6832 RepID=A0A553NZ23_TIGCA|nr:FMRFamide receptor-like [Tigriopus californicus]TRY70678.1 hypothetical protein TCAL_05430 [Tigriopus californicus]
MSSILESEHQCSGASDEELELYARINWWTEGVFQMIISLIGLCGNSISIWILCSKAMQSIFNRLLIVLAIFDNMYLIFSVLDSIRHEHGTVNVHYYLFANVLYPLHNASLTGSIYMTVVLAFERYLAVSHPISYHNSVNSGPHWIRITRYVLPVLIFSVLFNLPKFFELHAYESASQRTVLLGNGSLVNQTLLNVQIAPTSLRLNEDYIFYYQNNARLLVTAIVPFFALLIFNYGIYQAVGRRKHGLNQVRGGNNNNNQSLQTNAAEENRQAIMLFAIVIFFLIFNLPRNFLSLNEVLSFAQVKEDYMRGCKGLALWILLVGTLSHLLLVVNSSMNFFLYCGMSTTFRKELKHRLCPRPPRHSRADFNLRIPRTQDQGTPSGVLLTNL